MASIWGNEGQHSGKAGQVSKHLSIPAVEVELQGVHTIPHLKVIRIQAFAEQMQRVYKNELGPQPVPLTVVVEVIDEDDKYFMAADDGSDDCMNEEILSENEENLSENEDPATEKRKSIGF